MYDIVLFPTDGSEASRAATDRALELADRFDAPLHVLYAVDAAAVQATDAYSGSNYEAAVEALEAEGRRRIEGVEDRAERAGSTSRAPSRRGGPPAKSSRRPRMEPSSSWGPTAGPASTDTSSGARP